MGKIKDFVQNITFGNRQKDAAEIPTSGTGLFWFVLRYNYLKLILLNLMFLLCCIPIVTIPASYCGMLGIIMKWTRHEPDVNLIRDFFAEFKLHFFGRLCVWLITTVAPFSVAGYIYIFTANESAFYAILIVLGFVSFALQSYFFVQTTVLEIRVSAALKNSFILLGLEWKATLKLLITGGLLLALCVFLTTYMIPFMVLCVFSLIALSVASEANVVIDKRLADKP